MISNNFIELFDNYLVINMAIICSSYDIITWFWRDIWLYWIHWTMKEKSRITSWIFVFFLFSLWFILLCNILYVSIYICMQNFGSINQKTEITVESYMFDGYDHTILLQLY